MYRWSSGGFCVVFVSPRRLQLDQNHSGEMSTAWSVPSWKCLPDLQWFRFHQTSSADSGKGGPTTVLEPSRPSHFHQLCFDEQDKSNVCLVMGSHRIILCCSKDAFQVTYVSGVEQLP